MALNMAMAGMQIGYISIEETPEKVMRNFAANLAEIENEKMRKGERGMSPAEFKRLNDAAFHLSKMPLRIADKSRDLDTILSQIDRWKSQHGIEVLIVDYLQRINTNDRTEYERVSRCSREIADAIKIHQLAGIVVAQINRGVEGRESKIPGMSDLRSSGQIEQDADGIIFLHREDYWRENDGRNNTPDNQADLIVAKWRDGERNYRVQLKCQVSIQRFSNREVEFP
jgi:replicative DNA helicase